MGRPLSPALAALTLLGFATAAPAARAQAPAAPPSADRAKVEDRVFALVEAHRCGQAKTEAERGNEPQLAEQIGQMCGLTPGAPSAAGGGGGGRRGGGQGLPQGPALGGARRGGA